MEGLIFDIQRGSFVDGPGIRTTVFMKGCNLRCRWCHNPESQSARVQMMVYRHKCVGCGKCAAVCQHQLESCDLCGRCELFCPNDARKICGRTYTAETLLGEILKDKSYYESSNGGVTFSGGECMLQADFLCETLKLCKENGIHTAVDTAGHVPWESFIKIMPYTDLFLYDIKAYTDELHVSGVGVSNGLIIDNLARLKACFGGEITVRIPVIGGYNANDGEMGTIAAFVNGIGVDRVELMPNHRMGEHKYAALGMESEPYDIPNDDDMARWREMFIQIGR